MKRILWGLMCVVVFLLPGLQRAPAQSAYHQLTLSDFEGMPRVNAGDVVAHIHCTIDFHYTATQKDGYYLLDFDIKLLMDKRRSWLDRTRVTSQEMLAGILTHEQGHYIIRYMEQQELLRTVGKTVFDADYAREAQNILDTIDAKYNQLDTDYDYDTRHMVNRVQQNSWNIFFDKKLAYMPPAE